MEQTKFLDDLKRIISKACEYSEKARRKGLLSLEDDIGYSDGREILLNFGLQFVIDGSDGIFVDKLLSNIISHETDPKEKVLKTIQKEAVLSIQAGANKILMLQMLISYVDGETLNALKEIFADNKEIVNYIR